MATTTRVLDANLSGAVFASNANDALEALDTCHSGSSAPTDEIANGKLWLDTSTTPAILKMYNNASWEEIAGSSANPILAGITVEGDVAVTGTVDGRNIASDGTKLDGIEAGAKGDQTASEILTLLKTVDGSGSGLNADQLDGLSEATFMRRSANSQLDMNNNDIVGVDQIFHEGDSNTYMQFHASDQWRVVTGGSERLEVNNSQITSTEPLHAPSFHGDGSSLTGISSETYDAKGLFEANGSSYVQITGLTGMTEFHANGWAKNGSSSNKSLYVGYYDGSSWTSDVFVYEQYQRTECYFDIRGDASKFYLLAYRVGNNAEMAETTITAPTNWQGIRFKWNSGGPRYRFNLSVKS